MTFYCNPFDAVFCVHILTIYSLQIRLGLPLVEQMLLHTYKYCKFDNQVENVLVPNQRYFLSAYLNLVSLITRLLGLSKLKCFDSEFTSSTATPQSNLKLVKPVYS